MRPKRSKKEPHPIFQNPYVKTALRSLLAHLGFLAFAYFPYLFFISNIMRPMITDGLFTGMRWLISIYALCIFFVIEGLLISAYYKDGQNKRRYLDMTAQTEASAAEQKLKVFTVNLRESLLTAAVASLLQLPSALFYAAFSFSFSHAFFFEKLQIGWVGLYLLFDSALGGMLVAFSVSFLMAFLGRIFSHRAWEETRIRR